jgi:hypothetical protein
MKRPKSNPTANTHASTVLKRFARFLLLSIAVVWVGQSVVSWGREQGMGSLRLSVPPPRSVFRFYPDR